MHIRDLKVNERGTFVMLLESVQEKVGRNVPYCVLRLKPSKKDTSVEARLWNRERASVIAATPEMSVVDVVLSCGEYNGAKNYVADAMTPNTTVNRNTFIEESSISAGAMYNFVIKSAASKCFEGKPEKAILLKLYEEYRDRLLVWPAAVSVHHNYVGGLLAHMGFVAHGVAKFYKVMSPAVTSSVMAAVPEKSFAGLRCILSGMAFGTEASGMIGAYFSRNFVNAPDMAVKKKYLTAVFTAETMKSYSFLNPNVLFTALLYRDIHNFIADPLAQAIGGAAADIRTFRNDARAIGLEGTEFSRMVEHCLLVDAGNSAKPVTAEAFLLPYVEKLADLAIRNAGNEQFDICTAFTAAAIHDIGKLVEYNADEFGRADVSTDGHLYGHSAIGVEIVMQCAEKLAVDPVSISKLLNCIASHHDKKEWGALAAPLSEEAEVVALMDYIDSRMDIYRRRMEASEPGTFNEESLRSAGILVYRPNLQGDVVSGR